jgi:hypothetical protein
MEEIASTFSDSNWSVEVGFVKLKSFLQYCVVCEANKKLPSVKDVDEYMLLYSKQYGLLDGSFRLTDLGRKLKDADSDNRSEIILLILKSFDLGHSAWVLHPLSCIRKNGCIYYYIFEASHDIDSSLTYAKFLSDLGVISIENKWTRKDRMYFCELTDLGKFIRLTLTPSLSQPPITNGQVPLYTMVNYLDQSTNVGNADNSVIAGGVRTEANASRGGEVG